MPTVDLPGMRSMRTDSACIARHRSSARPVTLLYFTPASGLNSNVVTTGPGWICATCPSTENSRHFSASRCAASISSRSSILRSAFGASSSDGGGSVNAPRLPRRRRLGLLGQRQRCRRFRLLPRDDGRRLPGRRCRGIGLDRSARAAPAVRRSSAAGARPGFGAATTGLACLAITSRRAMILALALDPRAQPADASRGQVLRVRRRASRTSVRTRTAWTESPPASSSSAGR